jgi:hypothetical protein
MPLRFHRRVSLFPGLRVNFSRSGASISIGHRGAWYTVGPKGRRMTASLPGTGLSYTQFIKRPPLAALVPRSQSFLAGWIWPLVILAIVAIACWLG